MALVKVTVEMDIPDALLEWKRRDIDDADMTADDLVHLWVENGIENDIECARGEGVDV